MKKKLGIIILLLIIAVGCFCIGQYNVKKSIFSLSKDFNAVKSEENVLYIPSGTEVEGNLALGSSYVTLTFDYEVFLEGEDMPEDANLEIDITCPDTPDARLQWAFEPGKMEKSGSMSVDLKAFKGKNINMKFTCKGSFSDESGIRLKNIYISKLYAGS